VNYGINEFSPILAQRPYMGRGSEPVTAHVAHVLVTSKGEHRIVWPHDRMHSVVWQHTRSTGMLPGKVKTVYDIDLGVRHLRFEVDLPGAGDTFAFHATAVVEWRVLDPSLVVRSQLRDVRPLIQPVVIDAMRRIAREYGVDQSAAVERVINDRLAGEALDFNNLTQLNEAMARTASTGHVAREYGLWTRTIASVQPDKTRLAQADEVRDLQHQIEAERLRHQLRILQEQNKQQVVAGRMAFYREAFNAGDVDRAVLQVAQNPEELTTVVQVVREQELAGKRLTIDFVNKLLEAGAIERWQINDQAKAALDWLRESTNAVLAGPAPTAEQATGSNSRKRTRKAQAPDVEGEAPAVLSATISDTAPTDHSSTD